MNRESRRLPRWSALQILILGGSLVPLAAFTPARAEDHFLVIGGGYEAGGNQVSLEKNVLLFEKLVREQYPSGAPLDLFFSDGNDPGRDVQFIEPESSLPRANLLLARVFRETENLGESYRTHAEMPLKGGTARANIDRWFATEARSLKSGDRLIVYATAHGGQGAKGEPRNTTLLLWGNERITVRELAGQLDKLAPGVRVLLVMVQCYAGGFADLVFKNADFDEGAPRENLCGFFATTHDRPAAGCTPDVDEENYHEYSTYFWEAIRGRTRGGQSVTATRDLDDDGAVSFAEAHAYSLIQATSVDIPVKTSDAFLRRHSRPSGNGLWSAATEYPALLGVASRTNHAVLEGLSRTLDLREANRVAEARRKREASEAEKGRLEGERRSGGRPYNRVAGAIQRDLTTRWPELKNRWNPGIIRLLTTEAEAVVAAITEHPRYREFERLRTRREQIEARILDQERVAARCERLIRTLDNVALEANLPKVAETGTVEQFERLTACESARIGSPPAADLVGSSPHIPE
jgi:hypothetical protein